GYRDALRAAGVPVRSELITSGDFTEPAGWVGVETLLRRGARFTAVFAANDLTAIGVLAALRARGFSVPKDISVAGIDDISLARYTTPALTTVRQPAYDIGRHATELLLSQLVGGPEQSRERIVLTGQIVERESVDAPQTGRRLRGSQRTT
ncbi:MAG: substrate-binding domain-containing protein, partial [Nocardioidaceae bacterium]